MSSASRTSSPWCSRNNAPTVWLADGGSGSTRRLFLTASAHPVAGSGTEVCPMSYGTNQGPFGCPVLSDPGVMLCAMPVTVRIDGLGELLDQQFSVASRGQLASELSEAPIRGSATFRSVLAEV